MGFSHLCSIVLHQYTTVCPPVSGDWGCFQYVTALPPRAFMDMFPFAHVEVSLGHLELPRSGMCLEDMYLFSLTR